MSERLQIECYYITYPILGPFVQICPILYGVLHGLGCPHGICRPAVQDEVAQERLLEGYGAHTVDTHAAVNQIDDGICVAAPDDRHLVVVVRELCTGLDVANMYCDKNMILIYPIPETRLDWVPIQ